MTLERKVAFVTGASRGIGAAVARALVAEGVRLGLASRSGDDLGLEGAVAQRCDVRDAKQIEALVDRTVETFGRLDGSSRTRASAPTGRSSTSRRSTSRRWWTSTSRARSTRSALRFRT